MLVTAREIRHRTGIPESTVRTWAGRNRLARHGRDAAGRTLYDLTEVTRVLGGVVPAPARCSMFGCPTAPLDPAIDVPLCRRHLASVLDHLLDLLATGGRPCW